MSSNSWIAVRRWPRQHHSPPLREGFEPTHGRPGMGTRREHDLLGDRDVPQEVYYGVHTLRAVENFPISGVQISIYPSLIEALASIKAAAAGAKAELRLAPK